MPSKVHLCYERVGELSSGQVLVVAEHPVFAAHFEKVPFDRMLYLLAGKIQEVGECEVWLERVDLPGSSPFQLERYSVEMLRTDPVAAVEAFTLLGTPSSFPKAKEAVVRPQPLRAGFDVLADAFGDKVYVRVYLGDAECPGCGLWSPAATSFKCLRGCGICLAVEQSERWAGIAVPALLATDRVRFYLPRLWNSGPWITHVDLEERYLKFMKDKEGATCSIPLKQL